MSWFDTSSFSKYSKFAKTALKQAQQNIDKVLDINDDTVPNTVLLKKSNDEPRTSTPKTSAVESKTENNTDNFFDSFLTDNKNKAKISDINSTPSQKQSNQEEAVLVQKVDVADGKVPRRTKLKDRPRKKLGFKSKDTKISSKEEKQDNSTDGDANDSSLVDNVISPCNENAEQLQKVSVNYKNINNDEDIDVGDNLNLKSRDLQINEQKENLPVTGTTSTFEENYTHALEDIKKTDLTLYKSCVDDTTSDVVEDILADENLDKNKIDETESKKKEAEEQLVLNNDTEKHVEANGFIEHEQEQENDDSPSMEICNSKLEGLDVSDDKILCLQKEVENLKSIIDARERKMVELSKENISLQESASIYKNQLDQLENTTSQDDSEMNELREEFTKRIGESDKKLQAAVKDRDYYKNKLIETEERLTQSANEQVSALSQSLIEKEDTIKGLLDEGEALSKKELDANNRIKKLRVKLKDITKKNETYLESIQEKEKEIDTLKEINREKEVNEKKIEAELQKLEGITDSQEDEISVLKEKLDDTEEKYNAMEATMQNAYAEINKLNLEKAQKDSEVQEASVAVQAKEELEQKLKELEKKTKYGNEELVAQLEDLQNAYQRLEQQSARKEDKLKHEIQDLHSRLEEGENRNQELSTSVTAATRPLLRQIENLQSSHANQADNWERVEKSLTERLGNLQHQLALASEKERSASEIATELKSKYKALNIQYHTVKEEKTKLESSLEDETNRNKELKDGWNREKMNLEKQVTKLKTLYEGLHNEKIFLEDQLSAEKAKYDNDMFQLNSRLAQQQQQQQTVQAISRQSSHDSLPTEEDRVVHRNESFNSTFSHQRNMSTSSSLHESFHNDSMMRTTTTASFEHIQSQLRKREGEVYVLQEEIQSLEKTKASLAQELVSLANKVEELENHVAELSCYKEKHDEMQSRYSAVLQMYGEKAEEADELRMDLDDIKNMYKQQIQDLLGDR
ncbi:TATA element modulatory factor-like [Hydractinia symbiolongicarpus]|uniref:TATA element modulatory factor-like n=1 Tax=Hydractinia symbiolongicarpus TaxID=13093 RepID=UPI00255040F4|nr:TATA element modulatory factor-like [Hydractinia symbiolongicarpus]